MSYQTQIPDTFRPPPFVDQRYLEALDAYRSGGHRACGPNIIALARPELDPSSRVHYSLGTGANYELKAKTDKVALMHVISVGPGRVRLGFREQMPVVAGDMVLVNLREAGHWVFIEGALFYTFTGDVAMAKIYRTDKPEAAPEFAENEHIESYRDRRKFWQDELFWNLHEVLNDYVVLGRDPNAEQAYRRGPNKLIEMTQTSLADGTRSDDERDSRFNVVYRRVLGAGPGRVWRREVDGLPDYEHSAPEVSPGDMMMYTKAVRAAELTFQGMPLEIIHAASALDRKAADGSKLSMHESVAQPIPWDVPKE